VSRKVDRPDAFPDAFTLSRTLRYKDDGYWCLGFALECVEERNQFDIKREYCEAVLPTRVHGNGYWPIVTQGCPSKPPAVCVEHLPTGRVNNRSGRFAAKPTIAKTVLEFRLLRPRRRGSDQDSDAAQQ
jgi:hypothetical protein